VCDNARYNYYRYLIDWAKEQRIEFVYLPAYSPNLNLIERFWSLLRSEVINSFYYPEYDQFRNAITEFLDNAKSYKDEISKLLTLNFRTVGEKSI